MKLVRRLFLRLLGRLGIICTNEAIVFTLDPDRADEIAPYLKEDEPTFAIPLVAFYRGKQEELKDEDIPSFVSG